jgi:DNA modification methylase
MGETGTVYYFQQDDARSGLGYWEDGTFHCCVTSPPYWGLRDYGHGEQIGLEKTPEEYVSRLVTVFREVRRVLRDDGTLWLVIGDSYARDVAKGLHKPGDAGKQNYIIERGGGRAASGTHFESESRGSSDGFVGRGDRAAIPNCSTGIKPKDLVGIPWMLAFALRADGWYLRSDIVWAKPNPMPESVRDRPTKSHEYLFLLSKSEKYYYDYKAIYEPFADARMGNPGAYKSTYVNGPDGRGVRGREGNKGDVQEGRGWNLDGTKTGRNRRDVWTVPTKPYRGAHFAVFPESLIEPCILAGSPAGGWVLDPFSGSGTVALVSKRLGRNSLGIELNPEYIKLAEARLQP